MTYVVNLDPAADHFEYPVAFGAYGLWVVVEAQRQSLEC